MNIKEIKNDKLEIGKIPMSADSILKDKKGRTVAYPLMSTSFMYLICGASGSGKTNLMINLLKNCKCKCKDNKDKKTYAGMFDNIVIVSPSLHTIKENDNIFKNIDESKKFKKLNEEVFDKVDELHEEDKHQLLILDDVSSDLKKSDILYDLNILTKNRRHKGGGLSIIIIAHKLSDYPTTIRNNASLIMLFKMKSKAEEEFIYNYYINFTKQEYKELLKYVFQGKHDFLTIDCSLRQSNKFEFFRNFNKLEF